MCARRRYGLDKRTFLSLVFLQHDRLAPDDLVELTTQDGEVIEVTIDAVATTVVEHEYLADDGTLSPAGQEAVAVGHQVYSDDDDVRGVLDRLRVQEVVDR